MIESQFRFTLSNSVEGSITLDHEPIGWDNTAIMSKRNSKWHGVFSEYTLKLGFHCRGGGYDYMVNIKDTQGVDANVDILIEINCDSVWQTLFIGKVHFQNYDQNDTVFNATIIQSDVPTKVKARDAVKVRMTADETINGTPLTPFTTEWYDFLYHAKTIIAQSEISGVSNYSASDIVGPGVPGQALHGVMPAAAVTKDEIGLTDVPLVKAAATGGFIDAIWGNNTGIAQNIEVDYNIVGTFTETASYGRSYTPRLVLFVGNNPASNPPFSATPLAIYAPQAPSGGSNGVVNVNEQGTVNIVVPAGLFVYFNIVFTLYNSTLNPVGNPQPSFITTSNFSSSRVTLSTEETGTNTVGKATAIHEGWAKISQVITDQTDAFRSEFFGRTNSEPVTYPGNGCGSFTALANGKAIRGFTELINAPSISLKDMYDNCNAVWNIGMGVEDGGSGTVIRVEEKRYFYDDSEVVLEFNNVPDVERSSFLDLIHSLVEIGYDQYQDETSNGLDEYCAQQQYKLPLDNILPDKDVLNEYQQIADFICSPYLIERTRRITAVDFPNEDTDYDDENFFIATNRSTDGGGNPSLLSEAEKDENLSSISNVLDPSTIYNIRLSPKRNLLRHMSFLGASMTKKVGQDILSTFVASNGEAVFSMNDSGCPGEFSGASLAENDDVQWDDTNIIGGDPLFEPEMVTFEYPLSFEQWNLIRSSSNGKLNFYKLYRWTDIKGTHEGFLWSLEYKPADGMAMFTIIPKYES